MNDNYRILNNLCGELKSEVDGHLLPYWIQNTVDNRNSGFHGQIMNDNSVVEDAPRSIILYTRILWTFSASYRVLHNKKYLAIAERAYDYIMKHFWDDVNGGVYWMVDHNGQAVESKKHVYAQAFALYGLSEYYRAALHTNAITRAIDIYSLLKKYSHQSDGTGYHEAFTKTWIPLKDVRLSDKDDEQQRSMNTHLHLFEAFANLYRVWQNDDLKDELTDLIHLFIGPVYNQSNGHFYTFFDEKWNPKTDVYSYGHDIEAVWLLADATRELDNAQLHEQSRNLILSTADVTMNEGIDAEIGGLYNSGCNGKVLDADKHWWAQAEAIVGFVHAYLVSNDEKYLETAVKTWEFVKKYIIIPEYGEWYYRVDRNGKPYVNEDKVGFWKCPYHNVRMGLEVVEVINEMKPEPEPGKRMTGTQ